MQLSLTFIPSSDQNSTSTTESRPATAPESHTPSPIPGSGPDGRTSPTTLAFTFLPDYTLELSIRSLLGSRSRLQDVPKIAQLIEARVHQWFNDRCVEPRFQQIVLPSLWPRKKTTRGGEEESAENLGDVDQGTDHERSSQDGQADVSAGAEEAQYLDLEQKMRAEGAKIRRAEHKANQGRERPQHGQDNTTLRHRHPTGGLERRDTFEMPGSMPGGLST